MAHTLDLTRLDEIFDELLCNPELSKWERGFVESLQAQKLEGKSLTDRQLEKLEEVHVAH